MASPTSITTEAVNAALDRVVDPDLRRSITELEMVRAVVARTDQVIVSLSVPVVGYPHLEALRAAVKEALAPLNAGEVRVDATVMDDEARERLRGRLAVRGAGLETLASARIFAVASGKGGVGKSTVAANLAVAFAAGGRRVALLDADVWGFSIPRLLGVTRPPLVLDSLLVPVPAYGVDVVSVGLLTEETSPVIWRGPMLHKMLEQFVADVYWDEPEILVVDMPPGTGDVALSISRLLPDSELIVVTTPQATAYRVAQRAAAMARKVGLRVAGVVENMSWFTAPDGARHELWGRGGGEVLAAELDVSLLGQIPFDPLLREAGDAGVPVTVADPHSAAAQAIDSVAAQLIERRPTRIRRPELRVTQA
jgi:ATP-binding protein involved in chromosome partitioning